jgi:hypothetical protein
MDHHLDDLHDRGLAFDLSTLLSRRRALTLLAGAGLAALAGCGSGQAGSGTASGTATSASTGSSATTCEEIPEETAGPYPGDGSNGPNALDQSGIVRSDIRSSFGSASGTAEGVPLTINLTIVDLAKGCAPSAGAAVYLWHCDREGRYSQLALPEDACRLVYATDGYGQSVRNLAQTSLDSDNVFRDGSDQQLAKVSGDVTNGFTAALTVPV